MNASWGLFGGLWEASWGLLEAFWRLFEGFLGALYWAKKDTIFSVFCVFSFLSALYWAADDQTKNKKNEFFVIFLVLM